MMLLARVMNTVFEGRFNSQAELLAILGTGSLISNVDGTDR